LKSREQGTEGVVQVPFSKDDFLRNYEQLNDDELQQVLADKNDLVPEAAAALEIEVQRRHITLPPPPLWVRSADRSEPVSSLEDYGDYTQLRNRYQFVRKWAYGIGIGPFVLGLALGGRRLESSEVVLFGTLLWLLVCTGYAMVIQFRYMAYKCPQCSDRYGGGKECRSCGFPRSNAPVVV